MHCLLTTAGSLEWDGRRSQHDVEIVVLKSSIRITVTAQRTYRTGHVCLISPCRRYNYALELQRAKFVKKCIVTLVFHQYIFTQISHMYAISSWGGICFLSVRPGHLGKGGCLRNLQGYILSYK